jgi:hypothetical protein
MSLHGADQPCSNICMAKKTEVIVTLTDDLDGTTESVNLFEAPLSRFY